MKTYEAKVSFRPRNDKLLFFMPFQATVAWKENDNDRTVTAEDILVQLRDEYKHTGIEPVTVGDVKVRV